MPRQKMKKAQPGVEAQISWQVRSSPPLPQAVETAAIAGLFVSVMVATKQST
jgi:hypothetical protein